MGPKKSFVPGRRLHLNPAVPSIIEHVYDWAHAAHIERPGINTRAITTTHPCCTDNPPTRRESGTGKMLMSLRYSLALFHSWTRSSPGVTRFFSPYKEEEETLTQIFSIGGERHFFLGSGEDEDEREKRH